MRHPGAGSLCARCIPPLNISPSGVWGGSPRGRHECARDVWLPMPRNVPDFSAPQRPGLFSTAAAAPGQRSSAGLHARVLLPLCTSSRVLCLQSSASGGCNPGARGRRPRENGASEASFFPKSGSGSQLSSPIKLTF